MNNKRIHELLEWVKSQKTTKRDLLNEKEVVENEKTKEYYSARGLSVFIPNVEPIYGDPYEVIDPLYEILQHLLEVDIKRRESIENERPKLRKQQIRLKKKLKILNER